MTVPARSLIIPMKDEATRIGTTLRALRDSGILDERDTELILVDDGSTDGTPTIADDLIRELGLDARVIRLPRNVGKGGAIQAGVAASTGEVVAFSDADLSAPPSAIEATYELVEAGKADMVVTTRVHPESVMPVKPSSTRRYGGKALNIWIRTLGLTELNDTQCGLKAYTGEAARALYEDLHAKRFAFDVEVIARAERSGYTVLELPIEWSHVEASRVRPFRDGVRMALDVLWLRWLLRRDARDDSAR